MKNGLTSHHVTGHSHLTAPPMDGHFLVSSLSKNLNHFYSVWGWTTAYQNLGGSSCFETTCLSFVGCLFWEFSGKYLGKITRKYMRCYNNGRKALSTHPHENSFDIARWNRRPLFTVSTLEANSLINSVLLLFIIICRRILRDTERLKGTLHCEYIQDSSQWSVLSRSPETNLHDTKLMSFPCFFNLWDRASRVGT